ncbi:MAG: putative bifunctional diguanylate cyclase/phosphodiesterase [Microthrixaceae bacterium]
MRTSTLLAAATVVPLIGAILVGWQSVSHLHSDSAAVDSAARTTEQAVHLARIQSALFDEMTWRSVDVTTQSAGFGPEALNGILEGDASELLAESVRNLDDAVAASGFSDVETAVSQARASSADLEGVLTDYRALLDLTAAKFDVVQESLVNSAGESVGGAVGESVDVLGMTVGLRESLVEQFYGFYVSVFEVRDSAQEEVVRLIDLRSQYDDTSADLHASSASPEALIESLDDLESDPDFAKFNEGVDEVVSTALKQGAELQRVDPLTTETSESTFEFFSPVLRTVEFSSELTYSMLDSATEAVRAAVDSANQDVDEEIRETIVLLLALVVVSIAAVALVARLIVRPLRALQSSAHMLEENPGGDLEAEPGGPAEVRDAADAIAEAAVHLQQASRQADALAAGDLDADVLAESVSGGLGAALQESVATLRESLARQEEFRHRLAHEAAHDGLTQLPNRTATLASLERGLARTARVGGQLAVLFVDLDDFKDINDLHGHHAGDAALREVARRLVSNVRAGDEVGRLGGDEFLVIAEPVTGELEAVELGRRILAAMAEPIQIAGVSFSIGACIGIAMAERADVTAEDLVRDADLALYGAKELRRGTVRVCDEELRSSAAETSAIVGDMRAAIGNDELQLHYQPIVDASSEEIVALEALLRWRQPGADGLVAPEDFIAVAERSSLITDIDLWVLDGVAAQIAEWRQAEPDADWPVSVNLSGRHLASARFVGDILDALARHDVAPAQLVVEITEGALVDDLPGAALKLQQLRDAGVVVSIDDFGTGYTSLGHLRSLPFDILKIDRTFAGSVSQRRYEATITKLMIDAGHLLGARVVAEGIETAEGAAALRRMGADEMQGFYFHRPRPADQLWESIVGVRG